MLLLGSGACVALAMAAIALAYRFAPRQRQALQDRLSASVRSLRRSPRPEAPATPPDDARLVGNSATRVYHALDDEQLPAEKHRVYFASEAEAEALGYRPAGQPA